LYAKLLSEERLQEAMALRHHMETQEQIERAEDVYERSKVEDRLEEAIEIRKILDRLSRKLASDATISSWTKPPSKHHITTDIIIQRLQQSNQPQLVRDGEEEREMCSKLNLTFYKGSKICIKVPKNSSVGCRSNRPR
jgi:hypothetical protein